MTYRERRERKAERLREWAEKREAKSAGAHQAAHDATAQIPFGQPILVGHHSERRHRNAVERGQRQATAAIEHGRKATEFEERAANIEAAADRAIYSDDENAIEALEERIAGLEAKRGRIKAYNASCRKGAPDLGLLNEAERASLATTARVCAYQLGKNGAAPAHWLAGISGNLSRQRKRLAALQAEAEAPGDRGYGRRMTARYDGACAACGETVAKGEPMTYYRRTREVVCAACEEAA